MTPKGKSKTQEETHGRARDQDSNQTGYFQGFGADCGPFIYFEIAHHYRGQNAKEASPNERASKQREP
jgi:hypothetical protein